LTVWGKLPARWAIIIASNNKVMAGAWLTGQADNVLRVTDIASCYTCRSYGF
jgi:glutaconyl-CoA decarboxylase